MELNMRDDKADSFKVYGRDVHVHRNRERKLSGSNRKLLERKQFVK